MDADQEIETAEVNIEFYESQRASKEPPWDGFCGLVKVCDDRTLKEQGVIRRTRAASVTHSRAPSLLPAPQQSPPPATRGPAASPPTPAKPPGPRPVPPPAPAPAPASPHDHQDPPAPALPPTDAQDAAPLPDWVLEYVLSPRRSCSPSSRPPSSRGDALSSASNSSEVQELLTMVQTEVELDELHQAAFTAPDSLLAALPSPPTAGGGPPPQDGHS